MQPKEIEKPLAAWRLLLEQWIAFVVGWQAVSLVLLLTAHRFSLAFFASQTAIIGLIVLIAFAVMGVFSRFTGGRMQGFGVATPWVVVIGAAGALASLLLQHH